MRDDQFPEAIFKPKKNRYDSNGTLIELGLIPFQASDVLAYLTGLDAKFTGRGWRDKEAVRWMFTELSQIPEPSVQLNDELLDALNIYLRAASAPIGGSSS